MVRTTYKVVDPDPNDGPSAINELLAAMKDGTAILWLQDGDEAPFTLAVSEVNLEYGSKNEFILSARTDLGRVDGYFGKNSEGESVSRVTITS